MEDIKALLWRRRQQFLVHSFLYYQLDESLIDDFTYDKWCRELVQLQKDHPDIAKSLPYHDLCIQLDESASGSYIHTKDYPDNVVYKALQLLRYRDKKGDKQ